MYIYLKSKLDFRHLSRIAKCVRDCTLSGKTKKLYDYSIPYGLRKAVFKTLSIPTYTNELKESKEYPFTKFISKNTKVFLGNKYFHIKIEHSELESLPIIILFLKDHNADYSIYIDCEFTNSDISFIQNIMDKFPDRKIYFKLSEIEFSYLMIKSINEGILYTETECLLERLEIGIPDHFEKDLHFKILKGEEIIPDVGLKRFYRIEDKRLGIVSENAMFPTNLKENSIIILQ